jgi:hypothetical protein
MCHPHLPKVFPQHVYRHVAIVPSVRGNGKFLFNNGKTHDGSVPLDGCVKVGYADADMIDGPRMGDCAHIS